jgi:hypothetical protein
VEEGEALKGEADEEMAVISSYLSTKDIQNEGVRSRQKIGVSWGGNFRLDFP